MSDVLLALPRVSFKRNLSGSKLQAITAVLFEWASFRQSVWLKITAYMLV